MSNIRFDYFEHLINNINLEVLEHGNFLGDSKWKFYNVNSPFNRLYFVLGGEGYVVNEHHKVVLSPGNMYLIPLHSTYNYVCDNRIEKFYVHFRTELFNGIDIFESSTVCMELSYDKFVVEDLIRKASVTKVGEIMACKAFLMNSVSKFAELLPDISENNINLAFKYHALNRYIKDKCCASLNVKQISDYLKVPASTLSKNFKIDTGLSLKNYIDKIILQTAKEKILLSDCSIKETAYRLGFSDEFYFSRFFKKHEGVSPRDYRINYKI